MPKEFSPDEINMYTKDRKKHIFYESTIGLAERMSVHADGFYPKKLLDERRPNEPQQVMDYRKKIFEAKTKPVFSKVFSSLQKIRRSADWNIRYEDLEKFTRIADGDTLEDYCEQYYPQFTSLTNWVFTILLRKYLIDPNAVVLVAPENYLIPENEHLDPVATIFGSAHIIDFKEDDFAVLRNPTGARYMAGNEMKVGASYFFVTTSKIMRYDQVNGRMQFDLKLDYNHNFESLPVFKLKGVVVEENEGNYLYESRIDSMIPELNEAIREYSDLQAAKVLHIYPERWEYTQNECTSCKGTGKVRNDAWTVDCKCEEYFPCNANGCTNGYVVAGPYSKIMVRPNNAAVGELGTIPSPPAGYIEKDVEIVKVMGESIDAHIYSALSAINFEFLARTPLSQSGVAKEVDKDELNNTVHSIAEDLVSVMDNCYWFIALWRYGFIYSQDEIADMVPTVAVPERFDILTSQHTAEDLKNAKENDLNPVLRSALEIDYAGSRFNTEPEVRDFLVLVLELDPLPNVAEDDKNSRLQNNGITKQTYVISSNIQAFVRRALEEDKKFAEKDLKVQNEVMLKYAHEQIAAMDEAAQIAQEAIIDTGLEEEEPIEVDAEV